MKMKINLKKILIFLIIIGLVSGLSYAGYKYVQSTKNEISKLKTEASNYKYLDITSGWVDLYGNGNRLYVAEYTENQVLHDDLNIDKGFKSYIAAYDDNGNEIARTPDWLPISGEIENPVDPRIQPDVKSLKELIRVRSITGTHYFTDMFLTINGNKLVPVCKVPGADTQDNCTFFNSSYTDDIIKDFDNDGLMGVIEVNDEFPATGGRGRPVLSGVYKYKDGYFEPQENASYNKIYSILNKQFNGNLLNKYEWDQSSQENFKLVKNVWTGD
jgi:hypothetical protein